jgi:hypothetical protein
MIRIRVSTLRGCRPFRMGSRGPHRPRSESGPIRTDRTEPHDPHRVDGAMDGSPRCADGPDLGRFVTDTFNEVLMCPSATAPRRERG